MALPVTPGLVSVASDLDILFCRRREGTTIKRQNAVHDYIEGLGAQIQTRKVKVQFGR